MQINIEKIRKMCYNRNNKSVRRKLTMAISYKRLWKLLIDKDIKKRDLAQMAGLSSYTLNKLNRSENVNAETLMKICVALDCSFDDIMEIIEENKK